MTGRERVRAAIGRQPVDRVPVGDFHLADALVAALLGRPPGTAVSLSDRLQCLDQLGCDLVAGYPRLPGGRRLVGLSLAKGAAATGGAGTAGRFGLPLPGDLDWREARFWTQESDRFVWGVLPGVFGELAYMVGYEDFLFMTLVEPDTVDVMAGEMVAYGLELAQHYARVGVDGFFIGDDLAHDGGMLLGPDHWRWLFLPHLVRLVEGVRRLGLPVIFHSDGNIQPILADLAATGIDGLHGLQPSAGMDLAAVKAAWGDRLCLWGNLDLGYPLVLGSPAELADAVGRTIAAGRGGGSGGGGYIFGTCSGLLDGDLPTERVALMYQAAGRAARMAAG